MLVSIKVSNNIVPLEQVMKLVDNVPVTKMRMESGTLFVTILSSEDPRGVHYDNICAKVRNIISDSNGDVYAQCEVTRSFGGKLLEDIANSDYAKDLSLLPYGVTDRSIGCFQIALF